MKQQPSAPPATDVAESIYPQLDPPTDDGSSFRLSEIRKLERRLELERDDRAKLYKKYRRAINVVDGVDTVLLVSSLGMGAVGVGLLSTIIAAPTVVALEAGALVCGLTSVAGKYVSRKLLAKAKKHDEIRVLALSKLDTVSDVVSHAIRDGRISSEEYKLVLDEVEKYNRMKETIRDKSQKTYNALGNEASKNDLIAAARASIMKDLAAGTLK